MLPAFYVCCIYFSQLLIIEANATNPDDTVQSDLGLYCLQHCDCCVALPRGAMGLSAVCDCGIS